MYLINYTRLHVYIAPCYYRYMYLHRYMHRYTSSTYMYARDKQQHPYNVTLLTPQREY